MEELDRQKTLKELNEFLRLAARAEKDAQANAEAMQHTESAADFSDMPLDFEESTAILMRRTEALYQLTTRYNRHSDSYLTACNHLVKAFRVLASSVITKAALEQEGFALPKLADLSLKSLYRKVSFNLRKCDAALDEEMKDNSGSISVDIFTMECRLYRLLERLKSTEERIQLIREGKITTEDILKREQNFSSKSKKFQTPAKSSAPRKAPSYPVMRDVVRDAVDSKEKDTQPAENTTSEAEPATPERELEATQSIELEVIETQPSKSRPAKQPSSKSKKKKKKKRNK